MRRIVLISLIVLGCADIVLGCSEGADSLRGQPDGANGTAETPGDGAPKGPGLPVTAALGARRLTREEYAQTLRDLVDPAVPIALEHLALDEGVPFDNDIDLQHTTPVLIEGVDLIAEQVGEWVTTQPAVKSRLYGCAPSGPNDTPCFRSFIETFGRRAFRRPLTTAEVDTFATLQSASVADNAFDSGAELALRAILSSPAVLYRFEPGIRNNSDGSVTLSGYEIATRLSYFVQGTTPDDALLDAAAVGQLATPAGRAAEVDRLLAAPRAKAHLERFHAMWLGYSKLAETEALNRSFRAESNALVSAVVSGGDYAELFRSSKTWLDATLAQHYGLPAPSNPSGAWVDYPSGERRGILSHGSVLAYGTKNGETSPTRRGIYVRTRLLCQNVPPPPPDVNVDQPPMGAMPDACKIDRYQQHASGSCAGCHKMIDPVGFGLENYDALGRFRAHDDGRPECKIPGNGEIAGVGSFSGPGALGELVLETGKLESCVAEKVYTYVLGRPLEADDIHMVNVLATAFAGDERKFGLLVRTLVADPTFIYRRQEQQ